MPIWPFTGDTTRLEADLLDARKQLASEQAHAAVAKLQEGLTRDQWEKVVQLAIRFGDRTSFIANREPVKVVAAAYWLLGIFAADQATARRQ